MREKPTSGSLASSMPTPVSFSLTTKRLSSSLRIDHVVQVRVAVAAGAVVVERVDQLREGPAEVGPLDGPAVLEDALAQSTRTTRIVQMAERSGPSEDRRVGNAHGRFDDHELDGRSPSVLTELSIAGEPACG